MNSRWLIPAIGTSLLVLPLLVVYAQSPAEGESQSTPAAPAAPVEESLPVPSSITSVEGVSITEEFSTTTEEAVSPEFSLGEALDTSLGTTTDSALLDGDVASSTASSTEPVAKTPATPRETRIVFLQPSVAIDSHLPVGPVKAIITLQNLTCRSCESYSPSVSIKAYYTPWYDNDGIDRSTSTTTERTLEQIYSVPPISPWQSNSIDWTGEIATAGRYLFIVEVDPENLIGAKDTYRTEFFAD